MNLQEMSVGYANGIRVMSMTHTGEPGFMLYIPIEVRAAFLQLVFYFQVGRSAKNCHKV